MFMTIISYIRNLVGFPRNGTIGYIRFAMHRRDERGLTVSRYKTIRFATISSSFVRAQDNSQAGTRILITKVFQRREFRFAVLITSNYWERTENEPWESAHLSIGPISWRTTYARLEVSDSSKTERALRDLVIAKNSTTLLFPSFFPPRSVNDSGAL